MSEGPQFLFVTCQVGAERAVKGEIARRWDAFRFAFSRPGFLTFKLAGGPEAGDRLLSGFGFCPLIRTLAGKDGGGKQRGTCPAGLGNLCRATGEQDSRLATGRYRAGVIGVSSRRSPRRPPKRGVLIRRLCPSPEMLADDPLGTATPGEYVLDCVMVEPDQWWVGFHQAASVSSCWPGGIIPLDLPAEAVSRGWLKMEEALQWSQLPIGKGARCVELGSSPGGSSQVLLARGAHVLGIDPAEMHAVVLSHANFTHIRRRVPQVRRREFRKIRWLNGRHERYPVLYSRRGRGHRFASGSTHPRPAA